MFQEEVSAMLFRKKIDRYCAYCIYAGKLNEETLICTKCGIVPPSHHCRRFRYDPLKRIPVKPKAQDFSKYQEKDFTL
jgi:hypothetical protein